MITSRNLLLPVLDDIASQDHEFDRMPKGGDPLNPEERKLLLDFLRDARDL